MRYGNQMLLSQAIKDAMGKDWKRASAGNAFSSLCRHPKWDGQPVSFSFTEVKEDETLLGVRVDSWFDTEEKE